METMQTTFIRSTSDGRKVEVIGALICIDGSPVADQLVEVKEHPNKAAILHALPNAAYMAGPIVLTVEEGSLVRGALAAAKTAETDPVEIEKRFRGAWNARSREAGIE
ncbi:conserved protein of unknown function [Methylocella tundrae]|jgi:hypothetical protein|uniref:Uncharacterized protein n=2 Tax=Methylocella tundrae TaxID=227605 RepID=A0A4U8YYR3_METTU|nr:conserved protein of unknown function [Methylocella tundrae]